MDIPSGIYSSFSDKFLVESLVKKKNIYNDIHSVNTNNTSQQKSKFKLCISLSETADRIIDGKIFGISCSYSDWHDKVNHIKVCQNDYKICHSPVLKSGQSVYLPQDMEVLSYKEIRAKIEDRSNRFKHKAILSSNKYEKIRKMFTNHLRFCENTSDSVNAIKSLISETPDLKPLKSYGVEIKE
ncbi:hypothetical protein [Candidatus Southlakia epibionticum]|uniref:Uncharacterized protein n=1 Tax=Candidatus Southlakia epibionticum TaxID=3043284 RepID=A0ABY8WV27_9BACT|nr:hypothetical protein SEML1_0345 [Candidatus Saccharimonadaceae bacterium ML1]